MEQQSGMHSATSFKVFGTVRTSQVQHSTGNGAVGACLTFPPFKLFLTAVVEREGTWGLRSPVIVISGCSSSPTFIWVINVHCGTTLLIYLEHACAVLVDAQLDHVVLFLFFLLKRVLHWITPSHIPWRPTISCW